ncbi:MAG: CHAP domain-containing protein [Candidatus Eremiobacteraeota bacterium]|nr:CHAP domain-containing protein [Candidatus Eremiobacteraeota bacterium]MCW5866331.1 CHAP domain-containing protein [Candidatus Eremiobacteraeota bacterium]
MGVAGATAQDPMFQMLEMQNQMLTMMIGLLMNLMQAQGQKMEGALSGSGGDISGGGGGSSAVGGGGGSSSGGGGGAANSNASSGPASPGAQGALDRARGMLGLNEHSNAAEINKVTKESGIDSSTTPWCAAFAINILKDAGILDTTGLKNPNYCPEIVRWAKEKNIWMERGSTPKPGDAILFDWGADGTSDHIGIVEKVENGKITTIEGNSSDSVKRNTYEIGSSKIMGFVKTKG